MAIPMRMNCQTKVEFTWITLTLASKKVTPAIKNRGPVIAQ
jgi:hypothetical protein